MKAALVRFEEKISKNIKFRKFFDATEEYKSYDIPNYAAIISFWLLVSFFPFLVFIIFGLGFLPDWIKEYVLNLNIHSDTLNSAVQYIFTKSNYKYLPINIIFIIWSSSKIIVALNTSLSKIFGNIRLNTIVERVKSLVFIFLFFSLLIVEVIFNFIISNVLSLLDQLMTFKINIDLFLNMTRYIALPLLLFIFLSIIYYNNLPKNIGWRLRFRVAFYGSTVFSVTWLIFAVGYDFYIHNFSKLYAIYGVVTSILVTLTLTYYTSYLLLVCALLSKKYLDKKLIDQVDSAVTSNKLISDKDEE